jgi:hypothetical protein
MGDQPYQFGDVVDGYRWTITGWEPVEAPERTVGVPKLLEKRYAATQEAQARQEATTQTLEDAPLVVVPDEPVEVVEVADAADPVMSPEAPTYEADTVEPAVAEAAAEESSPTSGLSLDEILGGRRTVVAAPDLSVTFDAHDAAAHADAEEPLDAAGADVAEPYDARPSSARSWYGLGLEPIDEPEEAADVAPSDDAFAAALELGARTFAEHYQPSEIEIAAGIASGAHRPAETWTAPAPPAAPWVVEEPTVAPETLDPHDAAYGESAPATSQDAEPPAAARPVTFSPPPPAGWYPGSV